MDDDLNISGALASLFEFVKKVSIPLSRAQLNERERDHIFDIMKKIDSVLGVINFEEEMISEEVEELLRQREAMRRTGYWEASDEIRKKLMTMGIEISDTPEGMTWRLKNKNLMDG